MYIFEHEVAPNIYDFSLFTLSMRIELMIIDARQNVTLFIFITQHKMTRREGITVLLNMP